MLHSAKFEMQDILNVYQIHTSKPRVCSIIYDTHLLAHIGEVPYLGCVKYDLQRHTELATVAAGILTVRRVQIIKSSPHMVVTEHLLGRPLIGVPSPEHALLNQSQDPFLLLSLVFVFACDVTAKVTRKRESYAPLPREHAAPLIELPISSFSYITYEGKNRISAILPYLTGQLIITETPFCCASFPCQPTIF
jgi:hypothetical protein